MISEFAICHVVRRGNVISIQNPSTVTNLTMEPYCILLPLTYVAVSYNVTIRKLTTIFLFPSLNFLFLYLHFLCRQA